MLQVFALAASVALNAVVFVFVFRKATARVLSVSDVFRGAVAAALVWQLLQSFGVIYVASVVKNATDTNGVFAFVLGLIAFLYLAALALVLCVEADAVRLDRLWPRSLMTPFTDRVVLTEGDRRAYTSQVEVQQMKGFERIDVSFTDQPPLAPAARVRPERPQLGPPPRASAPTPLAPNCAPLAIPQDAGALRREAAPECRERVSVEERTSNVSEESTG